jgi:polysaccharide chain length determinant protein (PEP-CTERM system associated)
MIPGKKYTPEDLLAILWQRKWLLIIPTVLAAAGTIAYTRTLPNRYKSETVIMVQPPRVRPDLVKSSVNSSPADRIQTITQQILSRTRLEAIIIDLNLYPGERRTGLMEDVVERMRRDVSVNVVRGDAFRVGYQSVSPITAMKVTERLGRLFIDENLRDREMLAEGTSQFLSSQLDDARRRLIEQEKKLEVYRRTHSGELPSQQQSNLTAISNLQLQLQALLDSISRDRDRLQVIQRDMADLTSPEATAEDAVIDASGVVQGGTTAQKLVAARTSLSQLQLRLKPEHPDIARMKRVIRDLEQRADAEAAAGPASPDASKPRTKAEIARRNRMRELQEDAEATRTDIARKEEEEKRLRQLASTYQARADAAPTRETELIELTRDYETVQKLYTSLLAKSEESKLAVNLETRQIGEQFRILDPARVPERPFSPNRVQANGAGSVAGLALGLVCILLLEWRDTSLKTDDDVKAALGLPVLALVPLMRTSADDRRTRRRRVAIGLAGVTATVLVLAAYWALRT